MTGGSPFDRLVPVAIDYAVRPIREAFNWEACLAAVDRGEWYVVAFRSVGRPEADEALLDEMDGRALAEASSFTGLLHYFSGSMDVDRRCLSMCVWESRRRARKAAALPEHLGAVGIADATYTNYVLERYRLTKRDGAVELAEIEPPQRSRAVRGSTA
jgi:hypothetical protein